MRHLIAFLTLKISHIYLLTFKKGSFCHTQKTPVESTPTNPYLQSPKIIDHRRLFQFSLLTYKN